MFLQRFSYFVYSFLLNCLLPLLYLLLLHFHLLPLPFLLRFDDFAEFVFLNHFGAVVLFNFLCCLFLFFIHFFDLLRYFKYYFTIWDYPSKNANLFISTNSPFLLFSHLLHLHFSTNQLPKAVFRTLKTLL